MKFIDPKLEDYCISKSTQPSRLCEELALYTQKHTDLPQMMIGSLESSLLNFLIQSSQVKTVLEIGTFTGYSALSMAAALPEEGQIITLERSKKFLDIAEKFWSQSPFQNKIKALHGPALESISHLKGPFDMVFVDADKENYLNYLKATLPLLSKHGFLVFDNCLWSGRVLEKNSSDPETQGIQMLTEYVSHSKELSQSLIPVRDGILLVRKKES